MKQIMSKPVKRQTEIFHQHPTIELYTLSRLAAFPIEMAFYMVIECMKGSKYSMYVATDNMTTEGDVHKGPFSTKNFVNWLQFKHYANIATAGPVTSLRTNKTIQGWVIHPNWTRINEEFIPARDEFIKYAKEIQYGGGFKQFLQGRTHERVKEGEELVSTILSEWGGR
jgi:hypothetical protein